MKKNLIKILLLVLLVVLLSSCWEDKLGIDGNLIHVKGKYYRLDNRIGNTYILQPVKIDSVVVDCDL